MSHYDEQREADEKPDWSKAPERAVDIRVGSTGALFFTNGVDSFYDTRSGMWLSMVFSKHDWPIVHARPICSTKPHQNEPVPLKPQNPYHRTIIGLDGSKCVVDVYRVLDAFKTDSPALDHAIKKILCPGTRHQKDREQDLKEAIASIEAELLLMEQRNGM